MKLRFVGYVCDQEPYSNREEMRRELQVENKLIVVTGGGGADAFPMMLECMKALHLPDRRRAWKPFLSPGR